MEEQPQNFHKKFFQELSAAKASKKAIEESIKRVKDEQLLREKVIEKGKFKVLILGQNEPPKKPSNEVSELQQAIWQEGFPCCTLGSDYYNAGKDLHKQDIQREMLDDNHLIILVNAKTPGVVDESTIIRNTEKWKKKTLFFFKYENFEQLVKT